MPELTLLRGAVLVLCAAPLLLLCVLAISVFSARGLGERAVGIVTRIGLTTALVASLTALADYFGAGRRPEVFSLGTWFASNDTAFAIQLAIDGLSLGFVALALVICNVVAVFSFHYLHREPGFQRYFFQMAVFVVSVTFIAMAGSIEVLFVGWELLGLSSALLVGFFHERKAPVENALRVFAIYRLSDAAMLIAAVLLHHFTDSGALSQLFQGAPGASFALSGSEAFVISLLFVVAVAAKSALWPLSGWLPRAMEGPTPSSAVFYGALSIHAGCFLLLRAEPLLERTPSVRGLALLLGLGTALFATVTARVQTDVKSAISYSALTQVGIIVVEIALGLRSLALLHIAGHACFRLLQFLSAPNILHDLHELESRLGERLPHGSWRSRPSAFGKTVYLLALERGFTDSLLDLLFVRPFRFVATRLDRFDRWLTGSDVPEQRR